MYCNKRKQKLADKNTSSRSKSKNSAPSQHLNLRFRYKTKIMKTTAFFCFFIELENPKDKFLLNYTGFSCVCFKIRDY